MTRRKRCIECGELEYEGEKTDEGFVCTPCIETYDDGYYEIYGDREDQISFDSAMYRN